MEDSRASSPAPKQKMRGRASLPLRLRLTLWVVVVFSILQWVSMGVFWLYKQSAIDAIFDSGMRLRAMSIAEQIEPWLPHVSAVELDAIARTELRYSQFHPYLVDVFDESTRPIIERIQHVDPEAIGVSEALARGTMVVHRQELPLLRPDETSAARARVVSLPMRSPEGKRFVLVFASESSAALVQRRQIGRVLVMMAAVGSVAAGVSGWLIAGIAVAPLERVRKLAATLGPDSLGTMLEVDDSSSEVSRLAEELDEARARLRDRFEAKERFLTNVSHELKTPISVLLTEAQTLDRSNLPEEAVEFIDSARDEMMRLGHLVDSFLTLTRIEDGKGLTRFVRFTANDLIVSALTNSWMMAEQHHVRLAATILGEEDMDAAIAGEPELLSTMLDNIVRNAIRFSPTDGRVELGASLAGDKVHITVRDEGPGIPPERLETIFNRYAQAHASERRGRGHGLGLAIAKGIAELHRGTITVANLPGRGCEFTVTLPLSRPGDAILQPNGCPDAPEAE